MDHASERCPTCGSEAALRPKLVLIDQAWQNSPGTDPRLFFFADVRVDDIKEEALREEPLEQFIEAFYCDRCNRAFVPEAILQGERWRLRWT